MAPAFRSRVNVETALNSFYKLNRPPFKKSMESNGSKKDERIGSLLKTNTFIETID